MSDKVKYFYIVSWEDGTGTGHFEASSDRKFDNNFLQFCLSHANEKSDSGSAVIIAISFLRKCTPKEWYE